MKKTKKRAVPVSLVILEVFLIILFAFLSVWWFGFTYPAFDAVTTKVARIPGLDSGISPQGLCILPSSDGTRFDFAMSGYIPGEPSRVYVVRTEPVTEDKVTSIETYVTFQKDGKPVQTHFGGIACTDDFLYIASGKEIIRAKLSDVTSVSGGVVEIVDSFDVGMNAAFCYIYGGQLYVGEFYRPGKYETDPSHYVETASGTNHALVYVYDLNEESEGGIADTVPSKVLSVCDQVQGIALSDEHIFLSTSYGLPDSKLYIYSNVLDAQTAETFRFGDKDIPMYILAPKAKADFKMPCMSEEIYVKEGRLYILFESMSKQYRYVVHTRITHILSVKIEDIL